MKCHISGTPYGTDTQYVVLGRTSPCPCLACEREDLIDHLRFENAKYEGIPHDWLAIERNLRNQIERYQSENATKDEEIARLKADVDIEDHHYRMQAQLNEELDKQLDAAQAQLAQARNIIALQGEPVREIKTVTTAGKEPSEEGAAPSADDAVVFDIQGEGSIKLMPAGSTSPVSADARFTDRERLDYIGARINKSAAIGKAITFSETGCIREAVDAAMLSAGLEPSVPAETPKVTMERLLYTFVMVNTGHRDALRACFRLAGCEDRIEGDK